MIRADTLVQVQVVCRTYGQRKLTVCFHWISLEIVRKGGTDHEKAETIQSPVPRYLVVEEI
jgi:hypothetical protein